MLSSVRVRRPEAELLLCCARTIKSPEVDGRIKALVQESLDWQYLLRMAHRHGLAPLLYRNIDAACPEAVPKDDSIHLWEHFHTNNLDNLYLTGELLRILNAFESSGIPAVPYKGPALAASIYGNLALREFVDLDILVHRHDFFEAEDLLTSLGYRSPFRVAHAQKLASIRSEVEHGFVHNDGKSLVELHWNVADRHISFPLDIERLWKRLTYVSLGGTSVPSFAPEDMLLILCVHGSKHIWGRLIWVCDIAELIRVHQDIEWDRIMAQASALGGERMMLLSLFLANDLLGAPLPWKVSQRVRADAAVKAIAGRITERLFQEDNSLTEFLEGSTFDPLYLKMRERLSDKIRYCFRKLTTRSMNDWELVSLPRFLNPLYYPLRIVRISGKYGRRALKRFH
jgi:hypothetical protein